MSVTIWRHMNTIELNILERSGIIGPSEGQTKRNSIGCKGFSIQSAASPQTSSEYNLSTWETPISLIVDLSDFLTFRQTFTLSGFGVSPLT